MYSTYRRSGKLVLTGVLLGCESTYKRHLISVLGLAHVCHLFFVMTPQQAAYGDGKCECEMLVLINNQWRRPDMGCFFSLAVMGELITHIK